MKAFYDTPEQLEERANRYFEAHPQAPTLSGLALFLGFASRQSLYDYSKRPAFSYAIARARLLIESKYEQNLMSDNKKIVHAAIFALTNLGWKSKKQIDNKIKKPDFLK